MTGSAGIIFDDRAAVFRLLISDHAAFNYANATPALRRDAAFVLPSRRRVRAASQ